VADQVSLFFVPVLDATTRRLVCTECGEDLDVPEAAVKAKGSATPTKPAAAPVTDKELEKRLAALKKRMGKP
jgi:hypothetical protein